MTIPKYESKLTKPECISGYVFHKNSRDAEIDNLEVIDSILKNSNRNDSKIKGLIEQQKELYKSIYLDI